MHKQIMPKHLNQETDLEKKKSIRLDIIIIALFLAVGVIIALVLFLGQHKGATVKVSVDGNTIKTFPLDTDTTYEIHGIDGGTNLLVIKDKKAYIEEASCPDGLCINMGKIESSGQSIVCLPNRVVVSIEGEDGQEPLIDQVVG